MDLLEDLSFPILGYQEPPRQPLPQCIFKAGEGRYTHTLCDCSGAMSMYDNFDECEQDGNYEKILIYPNSNIHTSNRIA